MKRIFKYKIPVNDSFGIHMPEDAVILSVQCQKDEPCIWVMVDEYKPETTRRFELYGTGHVMSKMNQQYIGTFQMMQGNLVYHLFEII
jgi:hypothetical protein